jgi:hypothetical protein
MIRNPIYPTLHNYTLTFANGTKWHTGYVYGDGDDDGDGDDYNDLCPARWSIGQPPPPTPNRTLDVMQAGCKGGAVE